MEMRGGKVYLLGCGPGGEDWVLPITRKIVSQADLLVGCSRVLTLFPEMRGNKLVHERNFAEVIVRVRRVVHEFGKVAWLCTGDSLLFSISSSVRRCLGAELCTVIPGVSPVQVAAAYLGLGWTEMLVVSAHGRDWRFNGLGDKRHLCVLAGDRTNLASLELCAAALRDTHQL